MIFTLIDRDLVDLQFGQNVILVHVDAVELAPGADRSRLKYFLKVFIQDGFGSSDFRLVSTQTRKEEPAPAGALSEGAFFSINEILNSELQDSFADLSQEIQVHPGMVLQYYTEAYIENDGVEIARFIASQGRVINAGHTKFELPNRSFFSAGFSGWLSNYFQPFAFQPVLSDQPVIISFLTNFSNVPTTARVEIWGIDTIIHEIQIPNLDFCQVYSINLLPSHLGESEWVTVRVVGPDGKVLFQPWQFQRIEMPRTRPEELIYLNHFRVPEVLPLIQDTQENFRIQRSLAELAISPRISSVVQRQNYDTAGTRTFSIRVDASFPFRSEISSIVLSPKFSLYQEGKMTKLLATFSESALRNGADELQIPLTFEADREEKIAVQLNSDVVVERETAWRIYTQNCELDAFGRRTGRSVVTQLEEYYIDDNSRVIPRSIKANIPGTSGYIAPYSSESCALATTPFLSVAISRVGSFSKNDCSTGYPGTKPVISVPSGAYGSELSQADADAKAEAFWRTLDTQAFANANGSCPMATPGLFGQYHDFFSAGAIPANWKTLTPDFTRVDPVISFNNNMDPRISQWFAIRWIGVLVGPFTGAVTFSILNDFKFLLRLDGQVVINLTAPNDNFQEAVFQMVAGRNYNLEIEVQQDVGNNFFDMRWRWPGQSTVVVPTANLFNYGSD